MYVTLGIYFFLFVFCFLRHFTFGFIVIPLNARCLSHKFIYLQNDDYFYIANIYNDYIIIAIIYINVAVKIINYDKNNNGVCSSINNTDNDI